MFDISFTELMVVGAVALVVLGPERLPKVARTVGHLVGRMQRYVSDVKRDINREMELDELRQLRSQMNEAAREVETSMREHTDAVRDGVGGIAKAVTGAAAEGAQAVSGAPVPPAPAPAVDTVPPAADTPALAPAAPDAEAVAASAAAKADAGLDTAEPPTVPATASQSQKA